MITKSLFSLKLCRYLKVRVFCSNTIPERRRVRSKQDMELKCRDDPVVVKLDTPEFHNIFTLEVMDLKKLFDKYQYEIRIAGGAVRDLLMGLQPKDLDFATPATPQQMKDMFTAENIRMINMTGEKHGTITPRINDKENFEVTTLRVDIVTDGRHAEVEFTTDWKLDANRRDLTINSMFLGMFVQYAKKDPPVDDFTICFEGNVYDYFFGYDDLKQRRVAFVGDADVRIKEDYLRIMRYFRFFGRIAERPDNHDRETLEVIRNNVDGLQNISGERIWMELKKILQGSFSGALLKTILDVGIGKHIGLSIDPNIEELDRVLIRGRHLGLHPMSYLAAMLRDMDEVTVLQRRLKFSGYDREMLYYIVEHRENKEGVRPLQPYEKLVLNTKIKQKDAVDYVREVLKYKGDEKLLEEFDKWEIPRFPMSGKILKDNGVPPGKMYGAIISKLKDIWIDNNYMQTAEDLAKLIPGIIEQIEMRK